MRLVKKVSLLAVLFFSQLTISGQILLIPEVQSGGVVMKQQLFSLVINNLSGNIKKASLHVSITDRISSQVVLEANSGLLIINPGVKRIAYQDLSPIQFAVSAIGFSDIRQLSQPLPVGEYLICYRLIEVEATMRDALASECVQIIAEPLSPPQLIQPGNTDVIKELRPVLSWTPPSPVHMFNNLSYDIILTSINDKQSPEEAVQRNIPVMTTSSFNNSILYPSSFNNLEKGKNYAWQVVAKDAGRFGGKSEVWTFTIMPDSVTNIIASSPYVRLKRDNTEVTVLHQGALKMEYFNTGADSIAKVEVYQANEKSRGRKPIMSITLPLSAGQNYLEYHFGRRIRLNEGEVYEVKLINGNKEYWLMKFTPKYYF